MSDCCCPEASNDGVPAGSGGDGGADYILRVGPDVNSTSAFPVITTIVSATIPAGRLAADGDMVEFLFGGNLINAGAAGAQFNPFLGIDAVFAWGAQTIVVPNAGGPFAWEIEGLINRKSATSFSLIGKAMFANVTTALTGIGSLAVANPGGPIAAPNANPACVWANAQQLIFNMSATIAGTTLRMKAGYARIE